MIPNDTMDLELLRLALPSETKYERTPFGKEMLKHFYLDSEYHNINHGSIPFIS